MHTLKGLSGLTRTDERRESMKEWNRRTKKIRQFGTQNKLGTLFTKYPMCVAGMVICVVPLFCRPIGIFITRFHFPRKKILQSKFGFNIKLFVREPGTSGEN